MRRLLQLSIAISAFTVWTGCGPNLSSEEFGTVVEGIPQVKGADQPYEMPELGPVPSAEEIRKLRD
jgi:hypothetical protein